MESTKEKEEKTLCSPMLAKVKKRVEPLRKPKARRKKRRKNFVLLVVFVVLKKKG